MQTLSNAGTFPQSSDINIGSCAKDNQPAAAPCEILRFSSFHSDRKPLSAKGVVEVSQTLKRTGNRICNTLATDPLAQSTSGSVWEAEHFHRSPQKHLPMLRFPLRQTMVSLEKMYSDLKVKVKDAQNYEQMYEYTKAYFKKALSHQGVMDNYLLYNALNLIAGCPTNTIDEICTELKVSGRQLRRVFNKHLKVNPKTCLRLSRLHKAAALAITADEIDFHLLIDQCGYFDQSHLGRDIRLLTGKTPVEFFRKQEVNSPNPSGSQFIPFIQHGRTRSLT